MPVMNGCYFVYRLVHMGTCYRMTTLTVRVLVVGFQISDSCKYICKNYVKCICVRVLNIIGRKHDGTGSIRRRYNGVHYNGVHYAINFFWTVLQAIFLLAREKRYTGLFQLNYIYIYIYYCYEAILTF